MTEKFPIAADQLRAMTEPSADTISQHIGWLKQYIIGMTDANWADMRVRAERQLHELSAALRAQSDVRAPASQGEPVANGPLLKAVVDWTYLHATEGRAWPSSKTIAALIAKAMRANPTQTDAEAMMSAAPPLPPPPPADLADVLENVRKGIESLGRKRHTGIEVPIELHKACQALTHMVKDSRS